MRKIMAAILVSFLVTMTIFSTVTMAEEKCTEVHNTEVHNNLEYAYYDADEDVEVYYDSYLDMYAYYDTGIGDYVYLADETDSDYNEYNGYEPDYSDLYQDEFQAAFYTPARVNSDADFYSFSGDYICTIPEGTYIQPIESIGRSGDITYIWYNDQEGYVYTVYLITPSSDIDYDVVNEYHEGTTVQLLATANLRDENWNILTTIPAGYGVELISIDGDRCWVRWNGWFGSIVSSAVFFDSNYYYVDDEEVVYYDDEEDNCYYDNDESTYYYDDNCASYVDEYANFGSATIKPTIGVNMRDNNYKLLCAIPCGEKVLLLEPLNAGGRTLVKWDKYVGTVLSSCLTVD